MVRAYNDWLAEYAGHEPARLGGIALVPNRGVDDAVAEIRRVAALPGIVGLLLGNYPHGDPDLAPEDDAVWEAVVESGMAAHVHVKLIDEMPEDIYAPGRITQGRAAGDLRFLQAPAIMVQLLNGGVFERFPELHVVFAEVDAGWVPYVEEQLDNRFRRRAVGPDGPPAAPAQRGARRALLVHLHHRHLRRAQPPRHRGRAAHVVERLPPLGGGLARLLAHDRRLHGRRARRRAPRHPRRERPAPVPLRGALTRCGGLVAVEEGRPVDAGFGPPGTTGSGPRRARW